MSATDARIPVVPALLVAICLMLPHGVAQAADGDAPAATPATPATPAATPASPAATPAAPAATPATPATATATPAATPAAPAEGTDVEDPKWVLQPTGESRPKVFVDELALEVLKHDLANFVDPTKAQENPNLPENQEDISAYYKRQIERIDGLINERKWEDALRQTDEAIKKISARALTPEFTNMLSVLHGYEDQIKDALERDEAEARFDSLHLKIEGILWAQDGPRLVLIEGEPRPLGLNDRVKDCVIINIDTDRVDFRFHYNRKRFEFPRYVGEDTNHK